MNSLLKQTPSPAQLVLLYGRRRVGKTVLARRWAEQSRLPTFYWAAERETAPLQRRKLFARILGVSMSQAPTFESWTDLWTAFAAQVADRPHILILDEVPHAAEADPAFLSALQHAWDQHFKHSKLILLLSGSHVHTMETLLARGSPLFGRFTGQWHLQPLAFSALRHFLPRWSTSTRMRTARALLNALTEFGFPDSSRSQQREIIPYRITDGGLAYLAYDLHFASLADGAVVEHPDWGLFGLDRSHLLTRLDALGEAVGLLVQRAGDVVRISWAHPSMKSVIHALTQ